MSIAVPGWPKRLIDLAVHDELLERSGVAPGVIVMTEAGIFIRYHARSDVDRQRARVHGWICPPAPTAEGRVAIGLTLAGELLEQSADGRLIRDGVACDPGRIIACGSVGPMSERCLRIGRGAAFLIGHRRGIAWLVRIAASAPLIWIYARPTVPSDAPQVSGWLDRATALARAFDVPHGA